MNVSCSARTGGVMLTASRSEAAPSRKCGLDVNTRIWRAQEETLRRPSGPSDHHAALAGLWRALSMSCGGMTHLSSETPLYDSGVSQLTCADRKMDETKTARRSPCATPGWYCFPGVPITRLAAVEFHARGPTQPCLASQGPSAQHMTLVMLRQRVSVRMRRTSSRPVSSHSCPATAASAGRVWLGCSPGNMPFVTCAHGRYLLMSSSTGSW
mmetsp:Transcript_5320/g.19105  ORF Transcript_5320/g.19105 Transcript_5320/m.19105 type:complete len:212 (-) Transcript_5320:536-1171(-)